MSDASSRDIRTILFTDVEGSTALRTERGDDFAGEVLRAHETIVREQVARHGGREVKALGDGFMLAFASVRAALTCAVAIQRGLARHNRDQPEQELRVRVGLNAGEVTEEGGDLFGEAVNAAARIAATAVGGEVLVSRVVKELAGTIPGLSFLDRGAVRLKGFPEAGHLYEVSWQEESEADVLRIRLLGEVDVRYGRERLSGFDSSRLQSLLAYLLVHHDAPQARQRLAFLFWPDSTEAQARTNFRHLLHNLRRALPEAEGLLEVTQRIVQWRPGAAVWLDVAEFERAVERAALAEGEAERRRALEEAAALYGGDLMPGCYDEWVLTERERLRQHNVEVLEQLTICLEESGDYRAAIGYGEMVLRHDPVHESTYRRLMQLHARGGERARALRVYHTCATVLERELGVEPSPPTRQAYDDLLSLESVSVQPPKAPFAGLAAAPLVGREREWERAVGAWHQAAAGRALVMLVVGEAGLGKSRLVEELELWCARNAIATVRSRAYAAEGRLAYAPVIEWLRSEGLRAALSRLEPVWLAEIGRLLPEVLSEHPCRPRPESLTEAEQRQRLFEALARGVLGGTKPLLLVLDDIQWCDQESLEFLHYLVRFDPEAPVLVAGTARPEEIGPEHPATALLVGLRAIERLVEISLEPLDRQDVIVLAEQLGKEPLDPDAAARLYRETEGNPLFVVEMVRAGALEGKASGLPGAAPRPAGSEAPSLPPKVLSALQGRLSQLSPAASALVALAAIVGREFTYEVLAEASNHDEDTLVAALDELWRRRIVREHGVAAYDFSHDKIREVAYAGTGPARRRRLHLAVAGALATLHASDPEPVSGQLAAHYERAGQPELAIHYYRQAAEAAQRVFANEEALPHLTRALGLLDQVVPGTARDEEELALRVALGISLQTLQGYGGPPTRENWARADELCVALARPSIAPVLGGLAKASLEACDFDRSLELGHRLLEQGETEDDRRLVVEGRYVLGATAFWRGELAASAEHLGEAIARYRPDDHPAYVALFGQDPRVVCLSRLALTLWYLGRPSDAGRPMEESLALAETLGHPLSLAYALEFGTWLSVERGEVDRTEELAGALAALSAERRIAAWAPLAEAWLGWVDARRGRPEAGVARISQGVTGVDEVTGEGVERTHLLFLLSQAHALAAQPGEALVAVRDALERTERTGQRYLEPELHRLYGELLAAGAAGGADTAAVEDELTHALDVARRQGAKTLELRAAISLARWRTASASPEKAAEARRILERVFAAFPEASRTADLEQARELLRRPT